MAKFGRLHVIHALRINCILCPVSYLFPLYTGTTIAPLYLINVSIVCIKKLVLVHKHVYMYIGSRNSTSDNHHMRWSRHVY